MKLGKTLSLACCAAITSWAVPANAAPVIKVAVYDYHPVLPAVLDTSFTMSGAGDVWGNLSFFSNYGMPTPSAWIDGPAGTFSFVNLTTSKPLDTMSLAPVFLSAGTYTLHIRTKDTDIITGSVLAAPEPAAWAFLMIGFGAIGVALRRNKTSRSTLSVSYT